MKEVRIPMQHSRKHYTILKQWYEKRLPKDANCISDTSILFDEPPKKYAPKDATAFTAQSTNDPGMIYIRYYK
ncbi:MAG: hypothetical protein PHU12_02555 [Candidatus Aenigmarchaeota archaeon]|nr:hypothetical protein [Candidatus Aenigmarchaeota archaeon]